MFYRLFSIISLTASLCCANIALAHSTPNSEVRIDFGTDRIVADIIIPQGEYAFATGNPTTNTAASREIARAFLARNVRIVDGNGMLWQIEFADIGFVQIAGPPDLHAVATARPLTGQSARAFTIIWTAVIDKVPNHSVLLVGQQDFSAGKTGENREVLGALQGERRTLFINRGSPKPFAGFFAAMWLGMEHIAKGHDHLLFLIALLLPAPLFARAARWTNERRRMPATLWLIAKIVTAFTIGHSLTLFAAAFFEWKLPARPVEILIALSILISAIHAIRPIFPNREPLIAGSFGFVHGLAFATTIGNFGLDTREKLLTIFGFNIGIELIQLLVVVAVMPSLLIYARSPRYGLFRNGLAGFTAIAAAGWAAERVSENSNLVTQLLERFFVFSPYIIILSSLIAAMSLAPWRGAFNQKMR